MAENKYDELHELNELLKPIILRRTLRDRCSISESPPHGFVREYSATAAERDIAELLKTTQGNMVYERLCKRVGELEADILIKTALMMGAMVARSVFERDFIPVLIKLNYIFKFIKFVIVILILYFTISSFNLHLTSLLQSYYQSLSQAFDSWFGSHPFVSGIFTNLLSSLLEIGFAIFIIKKIADYQNNRRLWYPRSRIVENLVSKIGQIPYHEGELNQNLDEVISFERMHDCRQILSNVLNDAANSAAILDEATYQAIVSLHSAFESYLDDFRECSPSRDGVNFGYVIDKQKNAYHLDNLEKLIEKLYYVTPGRPKNAYRKETRNWRLK